MEKKRLPAEGLKAIACLSMLIDHIGAVFIGGYTLRIVGRIAFPIYCFQLVEGAHYTRNPRKYALRLLLILLLSELPFDLAMFGHLTLEYQNVLMTLLLGFGMLQLLKKIPNAWGKLLTALPFMAAAELAHCDYGAQGILMILLFALARDYGWGMGKLALGLALVSLSRPSLPVPIWGFPVPIELFSMLALIPMAFYSGKKASTGWVLSWFFYSFYPLHLTVLMLIRFFLFS